MWLTALVLTALLADAASPPPWWNNALYYRILVDSFKDMDGDGLGDLQGVTKQLSYVRALGADAVILSSVSSRSMDCLKPGIMDFVQIDERYGTEEQFKNVVEKAKKLELKVLVTLELQTVSEHSELFNFSAGRKTGFENNVIWREGSVDEPPKTEDGIDWIWHTNREAYYASSDKEPLLNLCSEGLVAMLTDVQCTWLKQGVSGVLLKPDFPLNIECGEQLVQKMVVSAMGCARTANLEVPVILVETSLGAEIGAKYYGEGGMGANGVISHALASAKSASGLALDLHAAMIYSPQDVLPTWITSIDNESRLASRQGSDMVDAITMIALTLPGAIIIQQGDELGTVDTILEWTLESSKCWPLKGSPSAAPFPWDDSPGASFSTGEPWLPLPPNYRYANAKTEYANDLSHFSIVRLVSAMRKSSILGPHIEIKRMGDTLALLRWGGSGSLLCLSNLGRAQSEVQLSRIPGLPAEVTVALTSAGSSFSPGNRVSIEKGFKLGSGEAVILIGSPRHCGGPGPVDKIANKLSEGWQKINKYFSNL